MHAAMTALEGRPSKFDSFWQQQQRENYTAVFNPHLDARIHDVRFGLNERVLDWIVRHAWGFHSSFALDRPGGRAATQAQIARDLAVTRGAVSKAAAALKRAGYLERRQDDLLVPLRTPAPPNDGGPDPTAEGQRTWKEFLGQWRHIEPELVTELEQAEAREREARRKLMQKFREWKKDVSTTETPDRPADVSTTETPSASTTETSAASEFTPVETECFHGAQHSAAPSLSERTEERKLHTPSSSSAPATTAEDDHRQVECALARHQIVADSEAVGTLITVCRSAAPDATAEEIAAAIDARSQQAQHARNPIGLILTAVPKLFRGRQEWLEEFRRRKVAAKARADQQRRAALDTAHATLADPHALPGELEWARSILAAELEHEP